MRELIIAACAFLCTTLQAQKKGFISGTFALSSSHTEAEGAALDASASSGTFGPMVGYHLAPEHVVGTALTFSGATSEYKVNTSTSDPLDVTKTSSLTTIAPFYRYMKPVDGKLYLYGQAQLGLGFGKETTDTEGVPSDTEKRVGLYSIGVGPGILFQLAEHWAISADWGLLGYTARKETEEIGTSDVVTKEGNFDAGLDPANIGFALNRLF